MSLILDCDACGAPMPAGRICPHCAAPPKPESLRVWVRRLALLGIAACGSASGLGAASLGGGTSAFADAYGAPAFICDGGDCEVDPCQQARPGDLCACQGMQLCACTDAGTCEPYGVPPDAGDDGG